ncbi:hypothetical protein SAMN05216524_1011394 [Mucilaginibacter sp. OK098]|nr:hypothetical protein SAMN05216524_1011394 [Mucilaginibacter sp. OK098]
MDVVAVLVVVAVLANGYESWPGDACTGDDACQKAMAEGVVEAEVS